MKARFTSLDDYPVVVEIPVQWGEMDVLQHVNNVAYFRYMESTRIAYFEKIEYMSPGAPTGLAPILASINCKFIAPLFYPDTISVGARVTSLEDDSFEMEYAVVSKSQNTLVALAQSSIVSYDYTNHCRVPIPASIRERIEALEQAPTDT